MKQGSDSTGLFPFRTFYEEQELEDIATACRMEAGIKTDELAISFEQLINLVRSRADLELEATLDEGDEASTVFKAGSPPQVRLCDGGMPITRLKMTLAHELGHIVLHQAVFEAKAQQARLEGVLAQVSTGRAEGRSIDSDHWIEWQARRFAGALLVPCSLLSRALELSAFSSPLVSGDSSATRLLAKAASSFQVSKEAILVRARLCGFLVDKLEQAGFSFDEPA